MEDTQKQDKLPPIKFTKRVGHLFEHVRDIDNLKEAIKDAAKHKRKRKEVQRVLQDIDGHARELQKMLDDETFIPAPYTMRRINDGIQKKTRDIAIPRFWPDQCIHLVICCPILSHEAVVTTGIFVPEGLSFFHSRCPYLFFIFCRIVPLGKDSKCR